jgi:hypothetical protein
MKLARLSFHAACAAALATLVLACGTSPEAAGRPARGEGQWLDRADGPVILFGTAVEASSGRPLPGVQVQGPGGVQTRTDEHGRFVLSGLVAGAQGELRATAADGRTAANRLRPLRPGQLEVVLYLR